MRRRLNIFYGLACPADRIRSFIHILIVNRADIKRYGCPAGTLSSELAKMNHNARDEAKAYRSEKFIKREVQQMCEWLDSARS